MEKSNIKACIRIRPLLKKETEKVPFQIQNNKLKFTNPKNETEKLTYEFDSIFDELGTQTQIFESEIVPIIEEHTCKGFNSTIFCYGRTSSGKTFTMEGNEKEPGSFMKIKVKRIDYSNYKIPI
jgi:hypothetical protein